MDHKSIFKLGVLKSLLYYLLIIGNHVNGYCLYGDKADCYFQCHCLDKSECSTGRCPSGCDAGPAVLNAPWQGDTCQTGNVALNKTATQPGGVWPASQAVDGVTRPDANHCAHPNVSSEGLAELVVDLGHIHRVTHIAIYSRNKCCAYRLTGFEILVRNDTFSPEELCVQSTASVSRRGRIDLNCEQPVSGRYVRFVRLRGYREESVSTLCEFIIVGHRIIDCSLCPGGVACNDVSGCERCVWSYQPDCKTVCEEGYYGDNCAHTCGMCDSVNDCDRTNGVCSNGCLLWYINNKCDRNIVSPIVNDEKQQEAAMATDNSLEVTWQPLTSIPEDLSGYYGYNVQYREANAQNFTEGPSVQHSSSGGKVLIEGLIFNTEYEVQITPYREMGDQLQFGPQSYPLKAYRTRCGIPEKPPAPTVTVNNSGSENSFQAVITMTPVSQLNPKCDSLTDVIIAYKASSQQDFTQLATDTATINVTIPGLVDEEYILSISVYNNEGLSSSSELVTFTKPDARDQVSGLSNNVVIIVSVVVSVVVTGITVTLVVFLVLRFRQSNNTTKADGTNPSDSQGVEMGPAVVADNQDISPDNMEVAPQSHYTPLSRQNIHPPVHDVERNTGVYEEIK